MIPGILGISGLISSERSAAFLTSASLGSGTNPSGSLSFGTVDSVRRIVCGVHWVEGGFHRTLNSATIGGVAATIHVNVGHNGGSTGLGAAVMSALVPTGTSGTVALSFSGTVNDSYVSTYRIVGMSLTDTGSDEKQVTTGQLSVTLTSASNGTIIGAYTGSTNTHTNGITWSANMNEQYDVDFSNRAGGAFATGFSSGSQIITATQGTISNSGCDLAVTSWG
jgi:hypothetical protein